MTPARAELLAEIQQLTPRELAHVLIYVRAMKAGRLNLCAYLERRAQRRAA